MHCHNLFEERVSVAKAIEKTKCESQEYQNLNETFTNLNKVALLSGCRVENLSVELIALINNVKCTGTPEKSAETTFKGTMKEIEKGTTEKRTSEGEATTEGTNKGTRPEMPAPTDKDFIVNAEFMKAFMSLDKNTRNRIGHR